ncbi:MAG: NADH-ubiquinone oxidoreductase-F iron-sulfur binding region domain-containing protein [Candidatus Pacebacteria bacterium]|nr:NADH-ubiquinone oxidoreductase-F iron-sulfur binding region domain-containing protein [Candidatus Paceibacterota bacterium]
MAEDFIEQLKNSGLTGRSGSNFPVWKKWQAVKEADSEKKYAICNASEGEPEVFKDAYIFENYLAEVVNGIKIALQEIGAQTAYIYLNKDYYQKFKTKLSRLIENLPIELFEKPAGYLAGEETSILNAIEGKRPEPRIKPPFPTEVGLWGKPTLINNVETFYWVNKIADGQYQNKRFYCVSGDPSLPSGQALPNKGVFELSENYTIEQILKETKNYPEFPFFCQVGGGASGEILLSTELNQPIKGLASIIVFNKEKTDPRALLKKWVDFFLQENCDKCTPCREGLYRVKEILQESQQGISSERRQTLQEIFEALEKTSLCPLGRIAALPFKSALEKLFK